MSKFILGVAVFAQATFLFVQTWEKAALLVGMHL
jgi:hypothetical protein